MKQVAQRSRTLKSVGAEWDRMAPLRARQLESGTDHSAQKVLAPSILRLVGNCASVVDVGCGTGWLSRLLSKYAEEVIGVDASQKSILIARGSTRLTNVRFVHSSMEAFASRKSSSFSVAVANMTFATVPSLPRVLTAIYRCLQPSGVLVFTIPHPCFWPLYWGYSDAPWFDYNVELAVAAPFRISAEDTGVMTTHVHRPLARYFRALSARGFLVDHFDELSGRGFVRPRFVIMRCIKR